MRSKSSPKPPMPKYNAKACSDRLPLLAWSRGCSFRRITFRQRLLKPRSDADGLFQGWRRIFWSVPARYSTIVSIQPCILELSWVRKRNAGMSRSLASACYRRSGADLSMAGRVFQQGPDMLVIDQSAGIRYHALHCPNWQSWIVLLRHSGQVDSQTLHGFGHGPLRCFALGPTGVAWAYVFQRVVPAASGFRQRRGAKPAR